MAVRAFLLIMGGCQGIATGCMLFWCQLLARIEKAGVLVEVADVAAIRRRPRLQCCRDCDKAWIVAGLMAVLAASDLWRMIQTGESLDRVRLAWLAVALPTVLELVDSSERKALVVSETVKAGKGLVLPVASLASALHFPFMRGVLVTVNAVGPKASISPGARREEVQLGVQVALDTLE